jgi:cell division protein FtsA
MLKNNKNIYTILDICSSKVVCLIVKITGKCQGEILGLGYVKADGIRAGIVSDMALAQVSIENAVSMAEKISGIRASRAYVSVSANYLISQKITTEIPLFSKEITHRELNKLLLDGIQICKNQKLKVIHTFACNYILDGHHGITNPIGMFGTKLACEFHILAATSNSFLNLDTVISKAGLEVEGYVSSMYSAGLAVLTKDEMENGSILLDIGSDTTSIGVFDNEQLILVDVVPIGGSHITRDIAKILSIPKSEAERIKNLYGAARGNGIDLNEFIDVKVQGENRFVSRDRLIDITHARIEEILNIVKNKTEEFKISNFVVTGGTGRMVALEDLIIDHFKTSVRVGFPKSIIELSNNNLELVTSLGIINHIINGIEDGQDANNPKVNDASVTKRFMSWLKRTFF